MFMPFGRLTLLRSVDLQLGSTSYDPRNNPVPFNPRTPNREQIWREWSVNFFQRPAHSIFIDDSEVLSQCAFPALEHLTLDFKIWQLQEHEGMFVSNISHDRGYFASGCTACPALMGLIYPPRSDHS